jgi:hypothetical protein
MSIASLAAAGVPAVFGLIKSLLPSLATTASSGIIGGTIAVLTEYAPLVVSEYKALKPIVENAITAIRANENTLPEQIDKLRAMATQYDLEWADALAVSRAGDAAAGYGT